jgi:tetratricopeptide (TPR) repeat protein
MQMSRFGSWSVLVLVGAIALATAAQAQSRAPDPLTRAGAQAQNADLQRRFAHKLIDDGRDFALDPDAGAEETRRTLLRRAALYEDGRYYDLAEADLAQALEVAPPTADAYAARGYFYMRRGRFADALADFLAGSKVEPDNSRLRYAAGRVQAARGDYASAVAFYGDAIRLAPTDPANFLARAEARIHLDQVASARGDYDHALKLNLTRPGDRYFAYLGRGYAALMQSDFPGAITDLDQALEIDPGSLNALLWRGYARERAGQGALALADYERAVAIAPGDRVARQNVQRLRSN